MAGDGCRCQTQDLFLSVGVTGRWSRHTAGEDTGGGNTERNKETDRQADRESRDTETQTGEKETQTARERRRHRERQRDTERETETQRDRQTETHRQRQRDRDTQRDRQTETERHTDRDTDRDRERHRQTERQTERQTDRQTDRQRHRERFKAPKAYDPDQDKSYRTTNKLNICTEYDYNILKCMCRSVKDIRTHQLLKVKGRELINGILTTCQPQPCHKQRHTQTSPCQETPPLLKSSKSLTPSC